MNQKLNEVLNSLKKYLPNGLVKDIRENWRIILVAIIVVAVFVNSWGGDQKTQNNLPEQPDQNAEIQQSPSTDGQKENNSNIAQAKEKPGATAGSAVKETAQKGEGVTHLARRAVKEYLASAGETLGGEQKIYVEDYLSKKMGSRYLKIDQEIEFETDLIKTGVEKAKQLNQKQIENLSKYVPLVKNLN